LPTRFDSRVEDERSSTPDASSDPTPIEAIDIAANNASLVASPVGVEDDDDADGDESLVHRLVKLEIISFIHRRTDANESSAQSSIVRNNNCLE
jgi:hypothetical protein